jgi:hypothetical protein
LGHLDTKRVVNKGQSEFSDFKQDFGMSGKLAIEDALIQMQRPLLDLPKVVGGSGIAVSGK